MDNSQQYNYQMESVAFTPNISTRAANSTFYRPGVPTTSYRAPLSVTPQSVHRRPLPTQHNSVGSQPDWYASSSTSSPSSPTMSASVGTASSLPPPPPPAPRPTMLPYQTPEGDAEGPSLRRRSNSLSASSSGRSQHVSFLPRRGHGDGQRRYGPPLQQQQQQEQQQYHLQPQSPSQALFETPPPQVHSQSQPRLSLQLQRSRSFREQSTQYDDQQFANIDRDGSNGVGLPYTPQPVMTQQQLQEQQQHQQLRAWQRQTRPLQPRRQSMNLSPEALAQNPRLVYFPPHQQEQLLEQQQQQQQQLGKEQQQQQRKSPRNSLDDAEDLLKRSMSRIQALGFSRSRAKSSSCRSSRRESKARV